MMHGHVMYHVYMELPSFLLTEADSLHYLSIEGLLLAVQGGVDKTKPYGHCTACLDGQYPVMPEW